MRRNSRVAKPQAPPKPNFESGEFPVTQGVRFLQDRDWTPYVLDGQVKWIDPKKPYDQSMTETEAVALEIRRDLQGGNQLDSMLLAYLSE